MKEELKDISKNYFLKNLKDAPENAYVILLFYKYVKIENTENLMEREKAVWKVLDLKGRLLIANEGINGTLEGKRIDVEKYIEHILGDKRFKKMFIKKSFGTESGTAFPKIKIKVKKEIVGEKIFENVNPNKETGIYLSPNEMNKWYKDKKDFVVVDMRNDYELESGYFENTINSEADFHLNNSRDLSDAIKKSKLNIYKDKNIVTVCTGGVRCEKMSTVLIKEGFKNVYQLHNGMHGYMEKYPGENFKGTLFTFDNRLVMNFGNNKNGDREIVGKCILCQKESEHYANCSNNSKIDKNNLNKKLCNKKIIVCIECFTKNKDQKENKEILCKECNQK